MEIAIGDSDDSEPALCHACEDAGCDPDGDCCAPHAYCGDAPEIEVDGEPYCEACGQPF